jgi:hypothetical protein
LQSVLRRRGVLRAIGSLLPILLVAAALAAAPRGLQGLAHAYTLATVSASGDIGLVPGRSDIELQPLPVDDPAVRVSAAAALATAEHEYSLQDSELDTGVGVVRAVVSVQGDPLRQNLKAWIVTANRDLTPPGFMAQGVFHKLCIVVSAEDGHYLFAYPTDFVPLASPQTRFRRAAR